MNPLKIGFAGSPIFAEKILEALLIDDTTRFIVTLVMTQPEKKSGRGLKLIKTPVSILAEKNKIPVFSPINFSSANLELKQNIENLDLLIVVAYGLILPSNLFKLPRYGCVNIHPSLLPRWRGAAPIQRAIAAGDNYTGVCLMKMESGLDKGPIWESERIKIYDEDTFYSLENRLLNVSIKMIKNFIIEKTFVSHPFPSKQCNIGVTIAQKIRKAECKVDWSESANSINNKIRAFNPHPGVFSQFGSKRVKMADSLVIDSKPALELPGEILGLIKVEMGIEALKITCGVGSLGIKKIQREGGKWISPKDFLNSCNLKEICFFS